MATAASSPVDPGKTLQDEATCSICLDYFRDPVMITDCGHSFCRACIAQCASCPQCRIAFPHGHLRPNRHLANMVEAIRGLRLQQLSLDEGKPGKEAPKLCGKHHEALRLFCQEDRAFICVVCRESRAHKAHAALPIDEAAQDAKDQLQSCLKALKKERDEILKGKWSNERGIQESKKRVESIRNQAAGKWELLDACEEIMKSIDKIASEFSKHSSHLTKLIKEVEEKCLQSAFELLQDLDSLLSRCNTEITGKLKADLNKKAESLSEKMLLVETKLKKFSGSAATSPAFGQSRGYSQPPSAPTFGSVSSVFSTCAQSMASGFGSVLSSTQPPAFEQQDIHWSVLSSITAMNSGPVSQFRTGVPQQLSQHRHTSAFHYPVSVGDYLVNYPKSNTVKSKWIKENVEFDPETAHPRYIVSSDGKALWWGDVRQYYPYSPYRFEYARCVLGMWGFSSGKHYWTVDVEDVDHWAVGVARESVERNREINFEPYDGIWAVGFSKDQLKALTSPPTLLEPEEDPTRIQVSLNYEAGTVAFHDADYETHLYTFESLDFEGENVFPFFRNLDPSACLQLCY